MRPTRAHASAALTLPITLVALACTTSHLLPAMTSGGKSGATRPIEHPSCTKSPALSRSTPEVGLSCSIGRAPLTALTQAAPPATPGKIFCTGAPALYAAYASDGVCVPGMMTTLCVRHHVTTSGTSTGATMNSAPASRASLQSSISMIVPQPTITLPVLSPSYFARYSVTRSRQPGVVSVNSTIWKPPSIAASIAGAHFSAVGVRSTAQARSFLKRFSTA
mmetsp:Transcript_19339/g.61658  ORF Transcript_19339/g.61658 Transcript_19339/m.61658 type:complete len:221 (+) Transcript_19339:174-836(+)